MIRPFALLALLVPGVAWGQPISNRGFPPIVTHVQTSAVTANGSIGTLPANAVIRAIYVQETAGHAVTGGVNIGSTAAGTDIASAIAVSANALVVINPSSLAKQWFSATASQDMFISAASAWNSASVNVWVSWDQNTGGTYGLTSLGGTVTGNFTITGDATFDGNLLAPAAGVLQLGNVTHGTQVQIQDSYPGSSGANTNYIYLQGSGTGLGIAKISSQGTVDTTINLQIDCAGLGPPICHTTFSNSTAGTQFTIDGVASAVNNLHVIGAATAGSPALYSSGSDTDVPLLFATKGVGAFKFRTGSSDVQAQIISTASAVNQVTLTGGIASGSPTISTIGSDTNPPLLIAPKGIGAVSIGNATNGTQFQIGDSVSGAVAVNYLRAQGTISGGTPTINAQGTDTNIPVTIASKGTGKFTFSNGGNGTAFDVTPTTSTQDFLHIFNGSTSVVLAVNGGTNGALNLQSQGNGTFSFDGTSGGNTQFKIANTASAISYPLVTAAASGGNPLISVGGAAANLLLGTSGALATSATTGFPVLPTSAGAPTGAATVGSVVVDTSNSKVCVLITGSTWHCI